MMLINAILNMLAGVLFLVVVKGTGPIEELRSLLTMTAEGTHWIEFAGSPVLMVLIPRLILARRLRQVGLVQFH